MATQNCHSQYIRHVIEYINKNSTIIMNSILSIMNALVPEDKMNTPILQLRPVTFPINRGIKYTPRDFIQDITNLLDFDIIISEFDQKIVLLCNSYMWYHLTYPAWFNYNSRKQSKENIEKYGMQLIKQLYFFKHLGKMIFRLINFRHVINRYTEMSELDQKIDQSKIKNKDAIVRKIVSDMNYLFNVINQEYQIYIRHLVPPINPSKSRSNMLRMESFFRDLAHLKQTSRKIKDLVTDNYSVVDNVGSSLAKFIQSPQQQKGDREMVCRLVTLLSINIAKQI